MKFDYVRTDLVYIPEELAQEYLERIIDRYLATEGRLLLTEYRSRQTPADEPWFDAQLKEWGLNIVGQASGYFDDMELIRVSIINRRVT